MINRAISGSSTTITLIIQASNVYDTIVFILLWTQKVHWQEFIPKALFIYLTEVQFLYSVESKMFYLSTMGTGVTSCVFKKYNKLLKFCSSDKYEYVSPSGVYLIFRIKLSHFDFFCHWCLDFTINIGVQPTCAHVAHNISPVPVLNCELLNGPEPYREGVLSFHGVKFSLENERKALNWSLKLLKTLQISAAWVGAGQTLWLGGTIS